MSAEIENPEGAALPVLARLASEFVVIVLGVLVALAVDEWRETHLDFALRFDHRPGHAGGACEPPRWNGALLEITG